MRTDFRIGFVVGIAATLAISVYCYELWQQERQVLRHSENLFRRIEDKNWADLAEMIASDYQDQWGNDRALVLETNSTRFELSPSFPDQRHRCGVQDRQWSRRKPSDMDGKAREGWRAGTRANQRGWRMARQDSD